MKKLIALLIGAGATICFIASSQVTQYQEGTTFAQSVTIPNIVWLTNSLSTNSTILTNAMTSAPGLVTGFYRCIVNNQGYVVGDIVSFVDADNSCSQYELNAVYQTTAQALPVTAPLQLFISGTSIITQTTSPTASHPNISSASISFPVRAGGSVGNPALITIADWQEIIRVQTP